MFGGCRVQNIKWLREQQKILFNCFNEKLVEICAENRLEQPQVSSLIQRYSSSPDLVLKSLAVKTEEDERNVLDKGVSLILDLTKTPSRIRFKLPGNTELQLTALQCDQILSKSEKLLTLIKARKEYDDSMNKAQRESLQSKLLKEVKLLAEEPPFKLTPTEIGFALDVINGEYFIELIPNENLKSFNWSSKPEYLAALENKEKNQWWRINVKKIVGGIILAGLMGSTLIEEIRKLINFVVEIMKSFFS